MASDEGRPRETLPQSATFLSFLSGFFDAEGSLYLHRKREGSGFEISFTNTDVVLLSRIVNLLRRKGLHPVLTTSNQGSNRLGYEKAGVISRIVLWRRNDIAELLGMIEPRHSEKMEKAVICLAFLRSPERLGRNQLIRAWMMKTASIMSVRDEFVGEAGDSYAQKHSTRNAGGSV